MSNFSVSDYREFSVNFCRFDRNQRSNYSATTVLRDLSKRILSPSHHVVTAMDMHIIYYNIILSSKEHNIAHRPTTVSS